MITKCSIMKIDPLLHILGFFHTEGNKTPLAQSMGTLIRHQDIHTQSVIKSKRKTKID